MKTFIELARQIQELFPTSDPDLVFVPYVAENTESKGHSGYLYNEYKHIRKELRTANILVSSSRTSSTEDDSLDVRNYFILERKKILVNCLSLTLFL